MHRLALSLIGLAATLSCAGSWQVDPAGPAATLEQRRPAVVRITTTDSVRHEVLVPTLQADSVVGQAPSSVSYLTPRIAIPLAEVALLEYRQSGGSTGGLILVALLVAGVVGLIAGGGPPSSF